MARETDRIVPVRIPGIAFGRTWLHTVCQRVAPSPKAASRSEFGTALIASCELMIIRGRMSKPKVRPAEMIVRPLAVVESVRPKIAATCEGLQNACTNTARPRMP